MTSSSLHDDYSHVTISGIRVPDDFSIITQDYYTSTSIPVPVYQYQYTSIPVYQYTSIPVYQYTSIPVYQYQYTSTSIPVPVPVHYPVIGVALSIDFTI